MMRISIILFLPLFLCSCVHDPIIPNISLSEACDLGFVDFTNDVLPLLNNSCATINCHDEITHEDGLRLTSYNGIMEDDEFVVAGDYKDSELYESITENINDDDFMPPTNSGIAPLTNSQIQMLKDWIIQGALETDCGCDTTSYSFTDDVLPIFNSNCLSCHAGNNTSTTLALTDYSEIYESILNGNSMSRINSDSSDIMPTSGKMDECKIRIIERWIENGAQDD
jgi:hypothetical protein